MGRAKTPPDQGALGYSHTDRKGLKQGAFLWSHLPGELNKVLFFVVLLFKAHSRHLEVPRLGVESEL